MPQLPFTFAGGRRPAAPPERTPKVLTVSALQRLLRQEMEQAHGLVLVSGEISNFLVHARSGHAYFTLKDDAATLKCVMWGDNLVRLGRRPQDGQQVIARGRLTIYERASTVQLSVLHLEPQGLGALQIAFSRLVETLREEGLTDPGRKRPLPAYPRVIGVVTSRHGAALRDILRTILRRDPYAHIVLSFASVQGQGAAQEIVSALQRLDALGAVDVIILARGGGSIEDLWSFNEEIVARAVASTRAPVVTGVGHETDTTVVDLVADHRASTPTAAAEVVTPLRQRTRATWADLTHRLHRAMNARIGVASRRIMALEAKLRDPRAALRRRSQYVDDLATRAERAIRAALRRNAQRLSTLEHGLLRKDPLLRTKAMAHRLSALEARRDTALAQRLDRANTRLQFAIAQLESLSPLAVLARGYAIARDPTGRLLRRAVDVKVNDEIRIELAEGNIRAQVLEIGDPNRTNRAQARDET
ncbi:MAG: exodeoxyribonuclease VII large subunit [Deltaproteobacteria bacterium]|nr:exodeoxyribonuclease VII large subunit [Deltaproteobacteria bacterium]